MVDDNAALDEEREEYKLEEDVGLGNPVASEIPPLFNKAPSLSRSKRLLVPVIVIIVIFFIYGFFIWHSGKKKSGDVTQEGALTPKEASTIAAVPAAPSVATVEQPPVQRLEAAEPETRDAGAYGMSIQEKLDVLASRTESNIEDLSKMKDTQMQMQSSLVNLNQSITALSDSMQALDNTVQKLAEAAKPKKAKRVARDVPPKEVYHVKAIVPGLAWLESSAGKTRAVRVGTALRGYGTVRLISPKDGMVVTSSGAVIQYGVNDF